MPAPATAQQAPQATQLTETKEGLLFKPQLGDPISQQVQSTVQQQQILPELKNRNTPAKPAYQGLMDDMELTRDLRELVRFQFRAPAEVRKWKDVWQWFVQNSVPPQIQEHFEGIQISQFSEQTRQELQQQQLQQQSPQLQQNGMPAYMMMPSQPVMPSKMPSNQGTLIRETPRDNYFAFDRRFRPASLTDDNLRQFTAQSNQDSIAKDYNKGLARRKAMEQGKMQRASIPHMLTPRVEHMPQWSPPLANVVPTPFQPVDPTPPKHKRPWYYSEV